jgi:hypothetical protein
LPSLLPLNLHRALSEFLDTPLPYDDVHTLRDRMWDISPTLLRLDAIESPSNPIATLGLSHMTQSLKGASDKVNAGATGQELLHDGRDLEELGDDGAVQSRYVLQSPLSC